MTTGARGTVRRWQRERPRPVTNRVKQALRLCPFRIPIRYRTIRNRIRTDYDYRGARWFRGTLPLTNRARELYILV